MEAKAFRFDTPKGTVIVAALGDDVDRKSLAVWHAVGKEGVRVDGRNRFGVSVMRPIFRAVRAMMPEVRHWVLDRGLRSRPDRVLEV